MGLPLAKYERVRRLAVGGMGEIFLARKRIGAIRGAAISTFEPQCKANMQKLKQRQVRCRIRGLPVQ